MQAVKGGGLSVCFGVGDGGCAVNQESQGEETEEVLLGGAPRETRERGKFKAVGVGCRICQIPYRSLLYSGLVILRNVELYWDTRDYIPMSR